MEFLKTIDTVVREVAVLADRLAGMDVVNRLSEFMNHVDDGEYVQAAEIVVETAAEFNEVVEAVKGVALEVVGEAFGIDGLSFERVAEGIGVIGEIFQDVVEGALELDVEDWARIASIGARLIGGIALIKTGQPWAGFVSISQALAETSEWLDQKATLRDSYGESMPDEFDAGNFNEDFWGDPVDVATEHWE